MHGDFEAVSLSRRHASFESVDAESTRAVLVIRDLGPWDNHPTVTNDAEWVVRQLARLGNLPPGRRLFYYDSEGRLDEILHSDGKFVGFRALTPDP